MKFQLKPFVHAFPDFFFLFFLMLHSMSWSSSNTALLRPDANSVIFARVSELLL